MGAVTSVVDTPPPQPQPPQPPLERDPLEDRYQVRYGPDSGDSQFNSEFRVSH